jgi:2-C-methyl-D-erythritol 4-phosphate cytidylyltransferase
MRCGAVIPAAGQARRFGDDDKTITEIAGRPVLEWLLRTLIDSGSLHQIVVVVSEANQFQVIELIAELRSPLPISTTRGGALRMDSVQAGVAELDSDCDLVLIHDAARPLVSPDLVRRTIAEAHACGAAIPGTPVTDTIKHVREGVVLSTVDRSELVAVQTPQVFRRDWLLSAYEQIQPGTEATDEAAILEGAGYPVRIVQGEPENIKLTTSFDAVVAESLLRQRGV